MEPLDQHFSQKSGSTGQSRPPTVTDNKVMDHKQYKMAIYIDNYRFWGTVGGEFLHVVAAGSIDSYKKYSLGRKN